jgi:predicted transposase/invertase (TIGR01784 family)
LYDPKTGSEFTDIIEVNILELPKLPVKKDDTKLWDWMQFFRSSRKEEFTMLSQNNPQIQRAVGVLMELSADEQIRLLYESREKARWDEMARLREAKAEGEKDKAIAAAKSLIQNNISSDVIAKATGLSLEEIVDLNNA